MNIKHRIICQNCGAENEYYKETCSSCKAYLRGKVFNIDLWKIIWYLIESPLKAFQEIIFSEHKNYIVFLLIAMGAKYFTNSLIIANFLSPENSINETPFIQVFPAAAIFIATILLIAYISTKIFNMTGYKNKFKSVAAVLAYSFMPSVMILFILAPIEFALFGEHWFYHNPSPLALKHNAAMVLYGVEAVIYLWGYFLAIKGFYALTGSKMLSIIFGLLFGIILTVGMFLLPYAY